MVPDGEVRQIIRRVPGTNNEEDFKCFIPILVCSGSPIHLASGFEGSKS